MELSDGYLQVGLNDRKQEVFYSVERSNIDFQDYMDLSGHVLEVVIHVDAEEGSYERRVYSLLDMTGQLGGLYEIFEVLGGILVGFFSERLLMLSLMSRLYQIEKPLNDDGKKYKDRRSPMAFESSSKHIENCDFDPKSAVTKKNVGKLNKVIDKPQSVQTMKEEGFANEHSYWRSLKEAMMKRRRYAYSISDYLYSLICCH